MRPNAAALDGPARREFGEGPTLNVLAQDPQSNKRQTYPVEKLIIAGLLHSCRLERPSQAPTSSYLAHHSPDGGAQAGRPLSTLYSLVSVRLYGTQPVKLFRCSHSLSSVRLFNVSGI